MLMIKKPSPALRALALTLSLCMVTAGCASTKATKITLPTYKPAKLKPPIEDRTKLPPKKGAPTVVTACSAKKGEVAPADCQVPFNGILVDQNYAARAKLYKAERDKLRSIVETDRSAFASTHKVHEEAINDLAKRAQRSWWENNKGTVGFWGGMVIGMGLAILAVYGVSKAETAGTK
ncbi:MAG: hypothetical protein GWO44_10975 [Thermoplasmata archaeon]|nr:hypothetical protein [Thermoplasmata archaeon]NIY03756.1 hypothetical protein [Thermoplasmata archaeon]